MTTTTGSTVPRRMLGRLLRQCRDAAGVSQAKAAKTLQVGSQTIWRMETGQNVILKAVYINALCELYNLSGEQVSRVQKLHQEAEEAGTITWWHAYGAETIPPHFDLYMGLEDAAARLTSYQSSLLPGLLQTADYRRQVIWTESPNMFSDEIDRRIELHTKRVQRLTDPRHPITLAVLLDESVLRRVAGTPDIMATQLRHLLAVDKLPNVQIRVVPLSAGVHVGNISGAFVLLEFPPHQTPDLTEPPTVYVQGFGGASYFEAPDRVTLYRLGYAECHRLALDEKASRRLILEIAEELTR